MNKKINGNISLGNILVILTMLVTIVLSYSKLSAGVEALDKKADKEVVDVHFKYIQKQLDEIKTLIKERD
tara:strand:+ start:398 stop:607 length:210 start_codon:yes stop_codon:yes gene_type:complete